MVRWTWKPCGIAVIFCADLLERLERRAGLAAARIVGVARRLDVGPAAVEPVGAVGLVALARLQLGVEPGAPVGAHLLDLALGDDALADELLGVDLAASAGCLRIALYISGWVNDGSSPSLWPKRR